MQYCLSQSITCLQFALCHSLPLRHINSIHCIHNASLWAVGWLSRHQGDQGCPLTPLPWWGDWSDEAVLLTADDRCQAMWWVYLPLCAQGGNLPKKYSHIYPLVTFLPTSISLHNLYNPFQYLTFSPSHFHFLALKNYHYPGILSYWQSFSIISHLFLPGLSSLQSIGTRVMVRRHTTHHCPVSQYDVIQFYGLLWQLSTSHP